MSDDVALTDLEVIQQFSLAVRGASAPREAIIAALEADLAFLTGGRRTASRAAAAEAPARKAPARAAAKAPAKRTARRA
jgi:hypothetical protein